MKPTLFLCLLTILFSCTAQSDITPVKSDAPDLDFSKPIWVNEFQYDGVFTIQRNVYDRYQASYAFYGAEAKAFSPINDKLPLENGFWFSPKIAKFVGYLPYYSNIIGKVSINDVDIDPYKGTLGLSKLTDYAALKYDADQGLTWKVNEVNIPDNTVMKTQNNLTSADKPSFINSKDGIKIFPEVIKIEKSYKYVKADKKDLVINFDAIKNADAIYFQFDMNGYYDFVQDLGTYESRGFLKYLKGDAKSVTIKGAEIEVLLYGRKEFAMTVTAVKYYTSSNEKRKFLYKNVAVSSATIIVE